MHSWAGKQGALGSAGLSEDAAIQEVDQRSGAELVLARGHSLCCP